MATDKRLTFSEPPDKEYTASITVQLPTTSANNNHHHHHYSPLDIRNNNNNNTIINNLNNNAITTTTTTTTTSTLNANYCHNRAATRSLLQADNNSSGSITLTAESDEAPTPPPNYYEIPGIVPAYQGRTSGPPPSYDDVVNPNAPPPSYQSLFGQVREARKTSNGLVDLFRQLFLILIGTLGCTMIIGFLLLIPITMILIGIVYVNECRAENIPCFLVIGGLVWIVKNILNCYNQFKKDSSTSNRPPPRRTPISSSSSSSSSSSTNNTNSNTTSSSVLILSQTQINTTTATTTTTDSNNNNILAIASSLDSSRQQQGLITNTGQTTQPQASSTTRIRSARESHQQQTNHHRIRQPSLIGLTSFKCESMLNYFLVVWFLAGCIVVYRIYEPDYDNPLSSNYCNRTVYLYAFWLMTSAFMIMAIVLSCLCCLMASSLISCNYRR